MTDKKLNFLHETSAEKIGEAANEIRAVRAGLAGLRLEGTDDPRALDGFEAVLGRVVLALEGVAGDLAPALREDAA